SSTHLLLRAVLVANEQDIGVRQEIEFAGPQPPESHNRKSGGDASNSQGGLERSLGRGGVLAERVEDFAQLEQIAGARQEHAAAVMPSQDGVGFGAIDLFLGQVGKYRIGHNALASRTFVEQLCLA